VEVEAADPRRPEDLGVGDVEGVDVQEEVGFGLAEGAGEFRVGDLLARVERVAGLLGGLPEARARSGRGRDGGAVRGRGGG
jgi:hypothetical protein